MKKPTQEQLFLVVNGLVAGLIFLTPSNLFLKFSIHSAYVNGLMVDYLLPKLYLSQVLVLALIVLSFLIQPRAWMAHLRKQLRPHWLLLPLLILLLLRQFLSPYPIASVWFLIQMVTLFLLVFSLFRLNRYISAKIISGAFGATLIFQSIVGLFQYLTQRSLGGFLFLGESNIRAVAGIVRANIAGAEKILPYGTTAHPNILAGTVTIFAFLLMLLAGKKWWSWVVILITLPLLFLAQSQAAWLTVVFVFLAVQYQKQLLRKEVFRVILACCFAAGLITVSLSFINLSQLSDAFQSWSWQRRLSLSQAAVTYFWEQPLWGTGLNTNAALNEEVFTKGEITRFAQPAHHVGVLLLSEAGLLGITLALWFFQKMTKAQLLFLVVLSPLLFLDHYLLTLQTGQLLIALGLSFVAMAPQLLAKEWETLQD